MGSALGAGGGPAGTAISQRAPRPATAPGRPRVQTVGGRATCWGTRQWTEREEGSRLPCTKSANTHLRIAALPWIPHDTKLQKKDQMKLCQINRKKRQQMILWFKLHVPRMFQIFHSLAEKKKRQITSPPKICHGEIVNRNENITQHRNEIFVKHITFRKRANMHPTDKNVIDSN